MTTRQKIEEMLDKLPLPEAIGIIEKVGMKYRKLSSINQNHLQMGRKVKVDNDRPDLMVMK